MIVEIRLARPNEENTIQGLFNHKCAIAELGGFTFLDAIKHQVRDNMFKPSLFVAIDDEGTMVGCAEIGGRKQAHVAHHGKVMVHTEFRRRGIGSALYMVQILQCLLEGRRKVQDTVVGDNPVMHSLLPAFGYTKEGELKRQTASGKDIVLYATYMDDVLLLDKQVEFLRSRKEKFQFQILKTGYTLDLLAKNEEIYRKHEIVFTPTATSLMMNMRLDVRVAEGELMKKPEVKEWNTPKMEKTTEQSHLP